MVVHTPETHSLDLLAPLSGLMVPLASVPDPVFAKKLAGDGIAIDPTSAELLAPVSGTVTQLHDAHHAIAITSPEGLEILLHIGLDTVLLRGEGFTARVALGDRVRAGQPLIAFDAVLVGRKARSLLTQMVFPGGQDIVAIRPAIGLVVAGQDRALSLELRLPPGSGRSQEGREEESVGGLPLLSQPVVMGDPAGLHARPAAILAHQAKQFQATIRLVKGGVEGNAKSVVAMLGLGVKAGEALQVKATGPDAPQALEALVRLLSGGLPATGAREPALGALSMIPAGAPGELGGVPASPGLAVGWIFQVRPEVLEVRESGEEPALENRRLEAALRQASEQLETIKAQAPAPGGGAQAGLLFAHQELLADPELTGPALAEITAGKSAAFAWREACLRYSRKLEGLDSPLLRERANDIRDVSRRVLALLTGASRNHLDMPPDSILIAEELSPSEAAQLDRTRVLGLCTTSGGPTGHVAILARSLGIPAPCGVDPAALDLPDRTLVVLDGGRGILRRDPGAADLLQARERITAQAVAEAREREAAQKLATTADGFRLEVAANIRDAQGAREAVAAGAEGVGLLRSEFLFLGRAAAPSEDEQAAAYGAVAGILGPERKLVIRTLDVGGDKPLAFLALPWEANPFLGLRGVRVSLEQPALFRSQLRAILRAAPLGDLHILFPMVSTLEELRAAKDLLGQEARSLDRKVKVGIMVEVPSAALLADVLAPELDFFSIGTNDLTQYCLAVDRGHPRLAKQADALHPSVLKLIGLTVEGAHRHGKWVGVCGGMASDILALPALLGLGVDELSVSVSAIGAIKAGLSRLRKAECEGLARELLGLGTAAEVRERLGGYSCP